MLPYHVTVDAEVDPRDVLEDLNEDDLVEYLESRDIPIERNCIGFEAIDYFHGDFDLKKLLKSIGLDEVRKVVQEIEEETMICIK